MLLHAKTYLPPKCAALTHALKEKVFYPNDTQYSTSLNSYWSLQARLNPDCIVRPLSANDVSKAVETLVKQPKGRQCQFAIRSGGHTPSVGAANIANGITIDLSLMNSISLSKDRKSASVGPGARWTDVYTQLSPMGVSVVGGRTGSVGVAGLLTGGV